jgi:heme exporter protein D
MSALGLGWLGPHAGFILASYAVTFAVVGALVVWIIADYRRQKALIATLEARGAARRSDREA